MKTSTNLAIVKIIKFPNFYVWEITENRHYTSVFCIYLTGQSQEFCELFAVDNNLSFKFQ